MVYDAMSRRLCPIGAERVYDEGYSHPGAEWVSITRLGSIYEEEIDIRSATGQRRHRFYLYPHGPWKEGAAPD